MKYNQILQGDCLSSLKTLPDKCVDICVTSPPYYALRDYGVEGQIGLEETPEAYIKRLADVFDEVYRVLKKDGTLWVNIGDSYNGNKIGNTNSKWESINTDTFEKKTWHSAKTKDLIGIPWMLAFELRKRGWYLRQDIIWHKPNPMPESVTDRCTKSHEYLFLLSKSPRYYFDHEAIQEEATGYDGRKDTMMHGSLKYCEAEIMPNQSVQSMASKGHERWKYKNLQDKGQSTHSMHERRAEGKKDILYPVRNKRSVWSVNTKPCKEAHFAVFPEELIAPCILAGSKEGGIVLDPFMGSGTTAIVSKKLGRKYLGCELNPEYIKIAERRLYYLGDSLFDIEGGVIDYQLITILLINSSQNICKIEKVFIILHHVSHRHRQSRYGSAVERRGTDSEYYDESSEILRFTSVG